MALVLRSEKGSRLTIAEMDGNFTYLESISGGNTIVTISATQAVELASNNEIIPNATYYIKGVHNDDVYPQLYGGTDILLTGLTTSQFSSNGYGKFYNPVYASYSIWDNRSEYNESDVVIYGGKVWINSGSFSSIDNNDVFSLNSDNWQAQSYTSSYYQEVWDEIEYDIDYNWICSRYDALNNNLVKVNYESMMWFYCNVTPIRMFRWGHNLNDNGVSSCEIINSYFGCLNFVNGTVAGVKMDNFSSIYDFQLRNNSYFMNVMLSNNSTINTISLDGVNFDSIVLNNNSEIANINIVGGNIENLQLSNSDFTTISGTNSDVNNIYLLGSSITNTVIENEFSNITLTNDSLIQDVYVGESSYITSINGNDSNMENLSLNNYSNISIIDMSSGYIGGNYLDSSDINDVNMYDSGVYSNQLFNTQLENIEMRNSSIQYNSFTSSGIQNSYLRASNIGNNYLNDGGIHSSNLCSSSSLQNLNFTNSSIYFVDLKSSGISDISLDNGYIEFVYLKDADLYNINLQNDNILQLDMIGADLAFDGLTCSIPDYTSFNTNTLKYQFRVNFDGTEGAGGLGNINRFNDLFVPQYFYIEKITLDTNSLTTDSDGASIINIGISGLTYSTGITDVDGGILSMANNVKVFDISNGKCSGGRTNVDTRLYSEIKDYAIISGYMDVEIILKNTNYGRNND